MMNQYFEQMVLSASPVELIRLLYQKAISSTRNAREHLRCRRIAERCSAINNAYLVLGELTASLRDEESPELAKRLRALYIYMQGRLIEANLKQQDEPLADVLGLLITLADAWEAPKEPQNNWTSANRPADVPGTFAISA
jgi:flagellar secretion chaperone FliS